MRSIRTLPLLGLALLTSLSLSAKPTFPKLAKEKGLKGVNCMTCHTSIVKDKIAFNAKGKFLIDRKHKEKAKEVDVLWLKDFKG